MRWYSLAIVLAVFAGLWLAGREARRTGKFVMTFGRQEAIWLWGLQEAHLLAAGLVLAGALWLVSLRRQFALAPIR